MSLFSVILPFKIKRCVSFQSLLFTVYNNTNQCISLTFTTTHSTSLISDNKSVYIISSSPKHRYISLKSPINQYILLQITKFTITTYYQLLTTNQDKLLEIATSPSILLIHTITYAFGFICHKILIKNHRILPQTPSPHHLLLEFCSKIEFKKALSYSSTPDKIAFHTNYTNSFLSVLILISSQ
ncbi:hypothetical protein BC833DRAFT_362103 [Globomyces pollinis-pini]|nr:hypothetical protein BC833DRAFT_362103 [Globomyces pollinis-pini]